MARFFDTGVDELALRPTIEDVGQEAGVSQATVSYVLSGSKHAERIPDSTKRRVWAAAEKLGYSRNATGTALKRGHSDTIVFLLARWHVALAHAPLIVPISRAAALRGLSVNVQVATDDEETKACMEKIAELIPYGLISDWETQDGTPEYLATLFSQGLPLVDLNPPGIENLPRVTPDRRQGFHMLSNYLIEQEHRRIGMILHGEGSPTTNQKLAGYKSALQSANIPFEADLVQPISQEDSELELGYNGFKRLIERRPDLTAILCTSDRVALGAMAAARKVGLEVPKQLSIAGYGGSDEGAFVEPSLTTLLPANARQAQDAIDMLVRLREETYCKPVTVYEPIEIVVRDSTGPAKS